MERQTENVMDTLYSCSTVRSGRQVQVYRPKSVGAMMVKMRTLIQMWLKIRKAREENTGAF